jgi:hypothetical protein
MTDLVMAILLIAAFLAARWYVIACETLTREDQPPEPTP